MDAEEEEKEHYLECAFVLSQGRETCSCEQIDREEEAYREEPPDLAAREWGSA